MWMITTQGFYSVVEHRDDPNMMIVRARVKKDLENLKRQLPDLRVYEDRSADYLYRADVSRDDWMRAAALLAGDVNYPNFKNEVDHRQGKNRHSIYSRVWGVLADLEPGFDERFYGRYRRSNWTPAKQTQLFEPDADAPWRCEVCGETEIDSTDETCPVCSCERGMTLEQLAMDEGLAAVPDTSRSLSRSQKRRARRKRAKRS
jgi:hypothetical protein